MDDIAKKRDGLYEKLYTSQAKWDGVYLDILGAHQREIDPEEEKERQKMGITVEEIKQAFEHLTKKRTTDKDDWQQLSKIWHMKLEQRIAQMQRLKDYMAGCIGCGCLSMKSCPLYNNEDKLAAQGTGAVLVKRNSND